MVAFGRPRMVVISGNHWWILKIRVRWDKSWSTPIIQVWFMPQQAKIAAVVMVIPVLEFIAQQMKDNHGNWLVLAQLVLSWALRFIHWIPISYMPAGWMQMQGFIAQPMPVPLGSGPIPKVCVILASIQRILMNSSSAHLVMVFTNPRMEEKHLRIVRSLDMAKVII